MSNLQPEVSVLFPAHKPGKYIVEALNSITGQTFHNLEILFLDNSRNGLPSDIWNVDKRIRYFKLPGSFGLSQTLNFGLKYSRGQYIVRMDFDDVSYPDRIKRQFEFMEMNPQIGISGTFIEGIGLDIDGKVKKNEISDRPTNSEIMKEYLLYKNPLFHPTVIIRRTVVVEFNLYYDKKYDSAEDYELWTRAIRFTSIGNLSLPLLKYRIHNNQYSRKARAISLLKVSCARIKYSIWVMIHIKSLRKKAFYNLLRNSYKYVTFLIKMYFTSSKFDKFEN